MRKSITFYTTKFYWFVMGAGVGAYLMLASFALTFPDTTFTEDDRWKLALSIAAIFIAHTIGVTLMFMVGDILNWVQKKLDAKLDAWFAQRRENRHS